MILRAALPVFVSVRLWAELVVPAVGGRRPGSRLTNSEKAHRRRRHIPTGKAPRARTSVCSIGRADRRLSADSLTVSEQVAPRRHASTPPARNRRESSSGRRGRPPHRAETIGSEPRNETTRSKSLTGRNDRHDRRASSPEEVRVRLYVSGATGSFLANSGGSLGTAINHDECDSPICHDKLVMSTCEKMPSPAVLDSLLLRIRPLLSWRIPSRPIATRHHCATPAFSRVGIQLGFLPQTERQRDTRINCPAFAASEPGTQKTLGFFLTGRQICIETLFGDHNLPKGSHTTAKPQSGLNPLDSMGAGPGLAIKQGVTLTGREKNLHVILGPLCSTKKDAGVFWKSSIVRGEEL